MVIPDLYDYLETQILPLTQRDEQTQVVTSDNFVLNDDRTAIWFSSLAFPDTTDYTYSVIRCGSAYGHARVIDGVDAVTKTLSWRKPLRSDWTFDEVTVTTAPLAGAEFFFGAGGTSAREVLFGIKEVTEKPSALGNVYRSASEEGLIHCAVQVQLPTGADRTSYFLRYWDHLYLREQIVTLFRCILPAYSRRIYPVQTRFSQYRQEQRWFYRADMALRYEEEV